MLIRSPFMSLLEVGAGVGGGEGGMQTILCWPWSKTGSRPGSHCRGAHTTRPWLGSREVTRPWGQGTHCQVREAGSRLGARPNSHWGGGAQTTRPWPGSSVEKRPRGQGRHCQLCVLGSRVGARPNWHWGGGGGGGAASTKFKKLLIHHHGPAKLLSIFTSEKLVADTHVMFLCSPSLASHSSHPPHRRSVRTSDSCWCRTPARPGTRREAQRTPSQAFA